MGLKQVILLGGAVATGIGVLYRKLDRDAQRHEANLEKTLREGLFRHGMHNGASIAKDNPDAVAYDEHGQPLTTLEVLTRVGKRGIRDPKKVIMDSIRDGAVEAPNEEELKW